VLGGWEPVRDDKGKLDKGASRWFSVELTKDTAPWAYERDGQPFRVIAALEAMASLVSFVLFAPAPRAQSGPATVVTVLPEFTDNRGNTFVLNGLMTTKYPLCCVLMELAAQMKARDLALQLQWAPRTVNTEADALTNGEFAGFAPELRIPVDMASANWLVLDNLMKAGSELQAEKLRLKAAAQAARAGGGGAPLQAGKRRKREERLRVREPW